MEGHSDSITCMVLDANILITGSDDCTIRLWNLGNFTPSGLVGRHQTPVQSMVLISETGLLLSSSQDKDVICWIYQKGKVLDRFSKQEHLMCMDYVGMEGVLMLGSDQGNILTHGIVSYINFEA